MGKRLVLLRGRGGTGKTVLLLQLARRLYEREEARVLLLTYNHALVADIRRLIALLQLTGADGSRALQVQTVHAHLHDVCTALGTNDGHGFPPGDQFDEYYCKMKSEALAYLRAGAVGRSDIEALRAQGAQAIGFDFVFVDEGQDWPGDERDLLYATYGHECLVVADGIEQLTRGPDPADWRGALRKEQVHTVFLGTALRMKANLARFVQKVSEELGVSYPAPNANDAVPGGQVLVVDGDYFGNRALHDELVRQNAAAGNQPVDMLFCVPPSMVRHLADGSSVSVPSERFAKWGLQVWDATDVSTRRGIPLDVAQHRLVQYDSCRGLEGWTVVAFRLDELYDYKQAALAREASGEGIDRLGSARKMAGFWTLIPLTRAMDTLVIHLGPSASVVRTALERVLPECEDFVRWQRC